MAYNNRNFLKKCEHVLRVTRQYYEPGRQDRCYHWVWRAHIRDQFHVGYRAYLNWLRRARENQSHDPQQTLFD